MVLQAAGKVFVDSNCELGSHLGFKGEKLGLVATLALFGEGLESFTLALVGLVTKAATLFEDSRIEPKLLLALALATLEPAAQYFQDDCAAAKGG